MDQNPPTVSETNHGAISYTNTVYTLAGTVGDTNSLGSLSVTESKNGGAATTVGFTSTPSSLAGVKSASYDSVSLPLGVGTIDASGHTNDGSYAYVLTATDVAGKTTVVNRTINIDTTPPTVSISQPGNYASTVSCALAFGKHRDI